MWVLCGSAGCVHEIGHTLSPTPKWQHFGLQPRFRTRFRLIPQLLAKIKLPNKSVQNIQKTSKKPRFYLGFRTGGGGWIRTTVGIASRFTVCPLWPLGNTPIFTCGAGGRIRTPDLLITKTIGSVQPLIFQRFPAFSLGAGVLS